MSDSVRPHRRQPTRLPCPWDSPGKNTGVGCHSLLQCMKVKSESEVAQSCPTLSYPMDCSLPGSSFHGIFRQECWSDFEEIPHVQGQKRRPRKTVREVKLHLESNYICQRCSEDSNTVLSQSLWGLWVLMHTSTPTHFIDSSVY